MTEKLEISPIGRIKTDYKSKFGIPRQSNLVKGMEGHIIFEAEYRDLSAIKGLEEYSYLWLIWGFSEVKDYKWSPTVRPPRLGGNKRVGVFASRSPFRPNNLGLSSVKIEKILIDEKNGPVIVVSGVDLLDNTPIYDIKPYVKSDVHPQGKFGISDLVPDKKLNVIIPEIFLLKIPLEHRKNLIEILELNPTPSYKEDPNREYGMEFLGLDVKFQIDKDNLTVTGIEVLKVED